MWVETEWRQQNGAWTPLVSNFHETRELTLRFEEVGRSATKASHAGIIRIGFEGISQPHLVEHPCFNNLDWNTIESVLQAYSLASLPPAAL
jgi:hypothetical protein